MNYVNIKGERINLDLVSNYSQYKNHVILIFPVYDANGDENVNQWVKFETIEEAEQCIKFLDKKTKCETFKLAPTE